MRRGYIRTIEPLKILTDSQIEAIHAASLDILEETGVVFENERALKMFDKNGCMVDFEQSRVRFPGFIVEECLRRVPSSFTVKARDPKDTVRFGGTTLYFMSSAGARIADPETGDTRVATLKENNDAVLISDAMENLDYFPSYTPYFEIEDVEPVMLCPTSCAMRHRYSTKISRGAQATDTYIWETQIAQACGSQLLGVTEAASPLTYSLDAINAGFGYAEAGFPIYITSGAIMGGSAPITIAGATIANNVELLALVVFFQLIRPGLGLIANDIEYPMNMRSGSPHFASLGTSLHQAAFNQIWTQFYKIPTNNCASGFPSSKLFDVQSGFEKTHCAMTSAYTGANSILLHGGVSSELAYNPLMAIIDDDSAAIIGKSVEGIVVDSEAMAIELIKQVGPAPGTFLDKQHTRKLWVRENYAPKCFDISTHAEWLNSGKKSAIDYAKEQMEDILTNHKPAPLTAQQDREVEKILEEARRYYKKKGML